MLPSLKVALGFVVVSVVLILAAYLRWWPAEPWDVGAFVLLALVVPFSGLAATLWCVARELPRPWGLAPQVAAKAWQSVLAASISFVHFLAGGALFLGAFQH
jgi:hypothetical protein